MGRLYWLTRKGITQASADRKAWFAEGGSREDYPGDGWQAERAAAAEAELLRRIPDMSLAELLNLKTKLLAKRTENLEAQTGALHRATRLL